MTTAPGWLIRRARGVAALATHDLVRLWRTSRPTASTRVLTVGYGLAPRVAPIRPHRGRRGRGWLPSRRGTATRHSTATRTSSPSRHARRHAWRERTGGVAQVLEERRHRATATGRSLERSSTTVNSCSADGRCAKTLGRFSSSLSVGMTTLSPGMSRLGAGISVGTRCTPSRPTASASRPSGTLAVDIFAAKLKPCRRRLWAWRRYVPARLRNCRRARIGHRCGYARTLLSSRVGKWSRGPGRR